MCVEPKSSLFFRSSLHSSSFSALALCAYSRVGSRCVSAGRGFIFELVETEREAECESR